MRRGSLWVVLAVLLVLVPGSARAQVAWDSPFLSPPRAQPGFGLYLIDVWGGGLGVLGTWRSPSWNFGVRGGIAEESGPDDDISIFGGVDFDGNITTSTDEFPLDIDWILGAGLGIGDAVLISIPVGLTIGHSFPSQGVVFTPFVTPRVVLDAFINDDRDRNDDVGLDFAVDVGLELRFRPNFTVRFGATVGDREAVAIGLVF